MPTKIEWADHSWNPVTGCTNISPGCDHCYAETMNNRFKRHPWGDVTLHPDRLKVDPHWKPGQTIFLCSMGDLFHSDVPFDFIELVFLFMAMEPRFTFMVLTKRTGRMAWWIINKWLPKWSAGTKQLPPNIWIGTSVESQKYIARLQQLTTVPAAVRFVSYEPALGPVDFGPHLYWSNLDAIPIELRYRMSPFALSNGVNWVIVGGESGPGARCAHPYWFRTARDQCKSANVAFFLKQWGEWLPAPDEMNFEQAEDFAGRRPFQHFSSGHTMVKVGKKIAGALLDGQEWRDFPKGQEING